MRKRRTIFYGRRADRTPKKDGDNPWVPERRGEPLPHEEVHLRFSNRTVTQFGGYLLWHEFCQKIGLQARLARHIRMSRGPLAFTAPELARFLLDAKFLGAQRLMHVDTLRLDPLLFGLSGIEDLPSGKTHYDSDCPAAMNFNADDVVDVGDALGQLIYMFLAGPAPPIGPFPNCAAGTAAVLPCAFESCP
ncbi:MAG: hypothetical protein ACE5GW_12160 [Planctomycetota bacterium]